MIVLKRVKYKDINLDNIGTVVFEGPTKNYGDCIVDWDQGCLLLNNDILSEECMFNLKVIGELRYNSFYDPTRWDKIKTLLKKG